MAYLFAIVKFVICSAYWSLIEVREVVFGPLRLCWFVKIAGGGSRVERVASLGNR